MDVTFDGKTMRTPVYIKVDAHDQLLLSEGVCRQLGILQYHSEVEPWRGGRKRKYTGTSFETQAESTGLTPKGMSTHSKGAVQELCVPVVVVPTVRVKMVGVGKAVAPSRSLSDCSGGGE